MAVTARPPVSDNDKIVRLEPKLQAKSAAAIARRRDVDRSAGNFRIVSRAVREMRDGGASSKEIANTLRLIADELEAGRNPA